MLDPNSFQPEQQPQQPQFDASSFTPVQEQSPSQPTLDPNSFRPDKPTLVGKIESSVVKAPGSLVGMPQALVESGAGALSDLVSWGAKKLGYEDQAAGVVGDMAKVQEWSKQHLITPEEAQGATLSGLNTSADWLARQFGSSAPEFKYQEFTSPGGRIADAAIQGFVGAGPIGGLRAAATGALASAAGQAGAESLPDDDKKYAPLLGTGIGLATAVLAHRALASPEDVQQAQAAASQEKAVPDYVPSLYDRNSMDVKILDKMNEDIMKFQAGNTSFDFAQNKGRANPYAGAIGTGSMPEDIAADLQNVAKANAEKPEDASSAFGNGTVSEDATKKFAINMLQKYGIDGIQYWLDTKTISPEVNAASVIANQFLTSQKIKWQKLAAIPDRPDFSQAADLAAQRQVQFLQSYSPYLSNVGRTLGITDLTVTTADLDALATKYANVDASSQDIGPAIEKMLQDKAAAAKLDPTTPDQQFSYLDKVLQIYRGFLLSSIKSTVRVAFSMTGMQFLRQFEKAAEVPISAIRETIRPGSEVGMSAKEYGAGYGDFFNTALNGVKTFGKSLWDEKYRPTLPDGTPLTNVAYYETVPGFGYKMARLLGRGISAMDRGVDHFTIDMELHRIAEREAQAFIDQGVLKPEDKATFKDNVVANPTPDMLHEAQQEGLIVNLKENTPQAFSDLFYGKNGSNKALQLLFPFPRIIFNAFKQGAIRVPLLGLRMPSEWAALKAGGRPFDSVISHQISGILGAGVLGMLYDQGIITGAAEGNYNTQTNLKANGQQWQPNSYWDGDKWVSWENIEPFNTFAPLIFGLYDTWKAANSEGKPIDIVQAADEHFGVPDALQGLWTNAISHHLYMQQLANIIEATANTRNTMQGINYFASGLAASIAVPRIINDLRIAQDDQVRMIDYGKNFSDMPSAIKQKIQSQIPYLSEKMQPKLDLFGRPVTYNPPLGEKTVGNLPAHLLVPFHYTDQTPDKTLSEINKYGRMMEDRGVNFGPPPRTEYGYRLTNEQLNTADQKYGQSLKTMADNVVNNPSWNNMSDDQKILNLKKIHDKALEIAHKWVKSNPEIVQTSAAQKMIRKGNYTGAQSLLQSLGSPDRASAYKPTP